MNLSSRRTTLERVTSRDASHAGLWLERYLPQIAEQGASGGSDDTKPQIQLIQETCKIPEPAPYRAFYQRWAQTLAQLAHKPRIATVQGRMAVGLGDEGVVETSVTLHHTYGVPYIPGSALKGLTAAYARKHLGENWAKDGKAYQTMFGFSMDKDNTAAGYVTFFDALYVPGSGVQGRALHADVMTVHHRDYYGGDDKSSPTDHDQPTPISFISATGQFLVGLGGEYAEWVTAAYEILGLALMAEGIGAKTSSGYGRLKFI